VASVTNLLYPSSCFRSNCYWRWNS